MLDAPRRHWYEMELAFCETGLTSGAAGPPTRSTTPALPFAIALIGTVCAALFRIVTGDSDGRFETSSMVAVTVWLTLPTMLVSVIVQARVPGNEGNV